MKNVRNISREQKKNIHIIVYYDELRVSQSTSYFLMKLLSNHLNIISIYREFHSKKMFYVNMLFVQSILISVIDSFNWNFNNTPFCIQQFIFVQILFSNFLEKLLSNENILL